MRHCSPYAECGPATGGEEGSGGGRRAGGHITASEVKVLDVSSPGSNATRTQNHQRTRSHGELSTVLIPDDGVKKERVVAVSALEISSDAVLSSLPTRRAGCSGGA